jgi:xylulose-5-phosphate/fructose-6-phosphate phosphoketolase
MHVAAGTPLDERELHRIDAYWRAANYLSVGQIYLMGNPMLDEPLAPEHIKPRLLGHWGTTPGLNLLYAHLNRVIAARRQEMIYIAGPGHGGPGLLANVWLEGSYSEVYPGVSRDATGMARLFKQFSFPGGVPSHVAPETPGSIHEGGELGYSLSHAYGAALDNPDLVVACVIGDGEAETGPLATAWHSNKFLDPVGDGAVLPILHLNGYKIANPTVLARISDDELSALMTGYGHKPYLVAGDDPVEVHQLLAATLDTIFDEIAEIQRAAREGDDNDRPRWPMIVLRTPKGWTGPKEVDGCRWREPGGPTRCRCRRPGTTRAPGRAGAVDAFLPAGGAVRRDRRSPSRAAGLAAAGELRMGANPHANGGRSPATWNCRTSGLRGQGAHRARHRRADPGAGRLAARRDDGQRRAPQLPPRRPGRDRVQPARRRARGDRQGVARAIEPVDEHLGAAGRVMEILSEHTCQGWLEGTC